MVLHFRMTFGTLDWSAQIPSFHVSGTRVVELFAAWCPDGYLRVQDMLTIRSAHVVHEVKRDM
jgi:hypothetical protein